MKQFLDENKIVALSDILLPECIEIEIDDSDGCPKSCYLDKAEAERLIAYLKEKFEI